MHPVKLLEHTAGRAAHVVRHPIASAAYAAGFVRGVAASGARALSERGNDDVPRPEARVDLPRPEPAPTHESFATEPTATSRDSAHGRSADAEIDAWAEDATDLADDVDIETPVGTTGADVATNPDTAEADLQQPGTEPLLDPGTAKAIRSEAETMQKAADPDKE